MSNYISTITRTIPDWQQPITTSRVEEFCGFLAMVLESVDVGYPLIGIVYSDRAGIGKTTAILAAAETALPPSHTGNPSTLLLELEPEITQVAFVELILRVLGERPRRRTKSQLQQRAEDHIDEALKHIRLSGLHTEPTVLPEVAQGPHEALSAERNEARQKGNRVG